MVVAEGVVSQAFSWAHLGPVLDQLEPVSCFVGLVLEDLMLVMGWHRHVFGCLGLFLGLYSARLGLVLGLG